MRRRILHGKRILEIPRQTESGKCFGHIFLFRQLQRLVIPVSFFGSITRDDDEDEDDGELSEWRREVQSSRGIQKMRCSIYYPLRPLQVCLTLTCGVLEAPN